MQEMKFRYEPLTSLQNAQSLKKGIMEIADLYVVTKADDPQGPKVRQLLSDLRMVKSLSLTSNHVINDGDILAVSASNGFNLEKLWEGIQYRQEKSKVHA